MKRSKRRKVSRIGVAVASVVMLGATVGLGGVAYAGATAPSCVVMCSYARSETPMATSQSDQAMYAIGMTAPASL